MAQTPPAEPAAAGGTGVVKAATLDAIQLPKPKKLPATGIWSAAKPTDDGNRLSNYMHDQDIWLSIQIVDCNAPAAKDAAGKPENQRGAFGFCSATPNGKLKNYPLYGTNDTTRAVKVGHLIVVGAIGVSADAAYTTNDVQEFLESLDLAALAKL